MEKRIFENKGHVLSIALTFFMGVLVHLMALTNRIFTADDYARVVLGWTEQVSVGRILFPFFQIVSSSKYNINSVAGLVALLFLSGVVELIICIFGVKETISKVIIASIVVMSPCAFSTMVYPSCSTSYFIAFFLAIMALYLMVRGKNTLISRILPISLMVISMMIYQVYGTAIIVLFLSKVLVEYLTEGKAIVTADNIKCIVSMLAGVVLYFVFYKIIFAVFNITPADYQGFNKVGPRLSISSILDAIGKSVHSFFAFWMGEKFGFYSVINIFFWAFFLGALLKILLKSESRIKTLVWTMVLLISMSAASFILYFTSSKMYYHNLMTWGCCFFYILAILISERVALGFLKKAIVISIAIICFYNYQNGNVAYQQLDIAREKTDYMVQRMLNDIDDISNGTEKIAIVGDMTKHDTNMHLETVPVINAADEVVKVSTPERFDSYTRNYYGRNFEMANEEELEIISQKILSDKKDSIDEYPYGNYCFRYKDYIVLNFGD